MARSVESPDLLGIKSGKGSILGIIQALCKSFWSLVEVFRRVSVTYLSTSRQSRVTCA